MNDKNNLQGKIKKSSLLLMLLLSIGGTIVIFTLVQITLISASAQYNIIKEDSAVYEEVVKGHARSIEKTLWGYQKELDYYVNADVMKTGTFEDMAAWLVAHESDRSKDFDYIMLAGSDGISHNDIGSQTDIANRDYFIEIMKNGKDSFIDNPVISRTNGKPVVHIARAVKRDGRTIAMLAGVIFLNDLTDEFSKIKIGKSGYGWMLASDGTVLYHPNADYRMTANFITDPPSEYKDISSVAKEVASGNLGTGWITGSDGVQDFVVYTGISGSPWGMAFTIPREQIYSVIKSIRYNMLVCGLVSVVITVLIGGLLLYFSIKPLKLVKDTILGIASGDADLTKRITIKKNSNEIGQVVSGFNQFAEKLQSIIKDVKESEAELGIAGDDMSASAQDTASAITQIIANIESVHRQIENQGKSVEQTAGAVNEIASNIASLENMIEGQSSGVSEASAAVEQMIGNIKSVNQSVDKMASSFGDLQNDAQLGFNKQQDVNERIRQIEGESEMLQEANAAISAIAEQTNLLAMNAAIEAAHAGEAGKGFSVVADEIRKLSETSTSQSKTIGDQLNNIKESIKEVVNASVESSRAFESVSKKINDTDQIVMQIKAAMEEQNSGSYQISQALHVMNDSTIEVRNAAQEMTEGNKAILEEVRTLQDSTGAMRQSMEEMSVGARKINETGVALETISGRVKESIQKIGNQIDQFKV